MKGHRVLRWTLVLALILVTAAAIGGGVVYATSRAGKTAQEQSEAGIVIAAVTPDGPAGEAGVVRGDILLKLGDAEVNSLRDLQQALGDLEAGAEVELSVLHGDDVRTLTATLGERDGRPYLGLVTCGEPGPLVSVEVAPLLQGAPIVEVVADGPADRAGLLEKDIIVAVDDQPVDAENDLADLIAAYAPGDEVTLKVQRPGEEAALEIQVTLGQHPDDAQKAYLGVSYLPQTPKWSGGVFSLPDVLPIPAPFEGGRLVVPLPGAVVQSVEEDSAAAEVGLQEGDVIVAVDGESVKSPQDLMDLIGAHAPGDTVTLKLHRIDEDQPLEVEVTLGEHPKDANKAYLGASFAPASPIPFLGEAPFRVSPAFEFQRGAIVRQVAKDSPAADVGLQEGDVITAIDGESVAGASALVETIAGHAPGDTITLTVYRLESEEEQEIEVTLAAHPDDAEKAYLGVSIGGMFWRGRAEGAFELPEGLLEEMPFGDGLRFDFRPPRLNPQVEPWNFEFQFPPELFEKEPCCSDSTL